MDPLTQQYEELKAAYPAARLEQRPDGSAVVDVDDVPLVDGWTASKTRVRFVVPVGYPVARPDCFWVSADLRLKHGAMPANSGMNKNHGGVDDLLYFSYHPSTWDPNSDRLVTYFRLVQRRLAEAK